MTTRTYRLDHDLGFAPNPYFGWCTLACCMPHIRRHAKVGDVIIGMAGKGALARIHPQLIYWMRVGEAMTCGKQTPGSPKWLNKTVATLDLGVFEAQLIGDYVGRRFATYTNDTHVPSYFLTSLRVAARLPASVARLSKADLALNVTNLGNVHGWSTVSIGSATNSYSAYPIAPRQFFVTLSGAF